MLGNLLGFGKCVAEKMAHHSKQTLTADMQYSQEDQQASKPGTHQQEDIYFCHSCSVSIDLASSYKFTSIIRQLSKRPFYKDLTFKLKDVFLDAPFQPPRHTSFS